MQRGVIQIFNVGAERMLGYTAAEVMNKITPADISDPQELIARAKALSVELATPITPGFEALVFKASRGIEDIYELTYIRKDGSRFGAVVSVTALRDAQDAIIGYLLIGTDNTARQLVEEERARLDHALQDKNAELESAKVVAEKANLAKSDFLSSMSHELRIPLSAILGFAQLMDSGLPLPTSSQKRSIDQILQAGWYLLELINEILDLALIESGKLSLSLEPISLTEVVRECQAMIEPQAQKRDIRMSFPEFEVLYFVKAERTRVKQVLINLLSNAIKYNKGRNRCRGMRLKHFGPHSHQCQRYRRRITTRKADAAFPAIQSSWTRGGQRRGHWYWTRRTDCRRLGTGSCRRAAAHRALRGGQSGEPDTGRGSLSAAARYSLIDSARWHPRHRDSTRFTTRRHPNGHQFARISGIRAMRILAEDMCTAHIPVVALSANAIPRDIETGLEAGFFRYLTKPIKVNEFMDTLDIALTFAKGRSALTDKAEDI
jgi:signal transduction histidine kinase